MTRIANDVTRRADRSIGIVGVAVTCDLLADVDDWDPLLVVNPIAEWEHMVVAVKVVVFILRTFDLFSNVVLKESRADSL